MYNNQKFTQGRFGEVQHDKFGVIGGFLLQGLLASHLINSNIDESKSKVMR